VPRPVRQQRVRLFRGGRALAAQASARIDAVPASAATVFETTRRSRDFHPRHGFVASRTPYCGFAPATA